MRCFIVTKADMRRFKVLPLIRKYGWSPTFICDNESAQSRLQQAGVSKKHIRVVPGGRSAVAGPHSRARDFAKLLMPIGQWSIWIDDNVESITGLSPKYSHGRLDFDNGQDWRTRFTNVLTRSELDWHIDVTLARADSVGTIFCGFATENNYFFRRLKWQAYGYCRTQFALYKNDGSTWMPFKRMTIEDLYKSVDVVARYGQIVINRHVKPVKQPFQPGGIGSFAYRLPWLQDNCAKLLEMYPGLLRFAGKGKTYGMPEAKNFHVTFAKRSKRTVDQWRREHGYL